MPDRPPILALSDGRPGHWSATAGMIEAVQQAAGGEDPPIGMLRIEARLRLKALRPVLDAAMRLARRLPAPRRAGACRRLLALGYRLDRPVPEAARAVVSTGGDTLFANALIAAATGAPNLFCGSLRGADPAWFRAVVTNRSAEDPHRLANAVVLEVAPMPRGPAPRPEPRPASWPAPSTEPFTVAFLIGGDGSGYRWAEADWRDLGDLVGSLAGTRTWLTTSRRTGPAAEAILAEAAWCAGVEHTVLFGRRPERVMAEFLGRASAFVVTEESATMVTEAVLTGRPVWLARPRAAAPPARHRRFLDQLVADGRARRLGPGEGPRPDPPWFRPIEQHPVAALAEAIRPFWPGPGGRE